MVDEKPFAAANVNISVTCCPALAVSVIPILLGVDPLQLTVFSMALTAVMLPIAIFPFLVLMNDDDYLGRHRNGRFSNLVVIGVIALAFVLAVVTIPLQLAGG